MFLTSTRCALVACRYLVVGYNEHRYMSAAEISGHYKMNVRALMPALRRLVQCGLLHSRRGSMDSGFIFVRHPKDISLWEIVFSLEGELVFPCCKDVVGAIECDCGTERSCEINTILNRGFLQIKKDLQGLSVSDFARL